ASSRQNRRNRPGTRRDFSGHWVRHAPRHHRARGRRTDPGRHSPHTASARPKNALDGPLLGIEREQNHVRRNDIHRDPPRRAPFLPPVRRRRETNSRPERALGAAARERVSLRGGGGGCVYKNSTFLSRSCKYSISSLGGTSILRLSGRCGPAGWSSKWASWCRFTALTRS